MDILHSNLLLPVLILFLAALVRATFGFGDALLAMPLLTLFISIKTATPVVAAFGLLLAAGILLREWKAIRFHSTWRLIAGSILGIPFGVLYIHLVPEQTTRIILGVVLVITGVLNLFQPTALPAAPTSSAYGFGFIAGILGSAYNTNGPPVLIYGLMRKWEPTTFRATMQSYFLPTNLLIILSHIGSGLWTPAVWQLFLVALPAVLLACLIGTLLAGRFSPKQFTVAIYGLSILMGMMMVITGM
jgi:uncharacterized protein